MIFLKQSTATTIVLGPFIDDTDGKTAETALTISQGDVLLWKQGGTTLAQKTESTSCTHRSNGLYTCPIDATDTGTLGQLFVSVNETGALPVRHDFMVVTANVWDSLFSTDVLDVSVTQWLGTAAATPTVAGVPEVDVTHWIGTAAATPTVAGVPEVDATHWNGTAVTTPPAVNVTQISGDTTAADNMELAFDDTAGPVPWFGIIDQGTAQTADATSVTLRAAAAFADDTLIGATIAVLGSTQGYWQTRVITDNALTGDTVTVDTWTVTPTGTITYRIFGTPPASATALPAVNLVQVAGATTDVSALATNVAAILVDTGTTLDTKINTIDDFLDTEVAAVLAAVDTEVAAILADTNELQTDWTNGGRLDLLLDGAASAGDPWTTTLPGAYGAGTAGYIVGTNVNATVSSRASQTSLDTVDDLLDTEIAAIKTVVDAIEVDTQDIQSRIPVALVGGRMNSNIAAVNNTQVTGDGSATPWGPV